MKWVPILKVLRTELARQVGLWVADLAPLASHSFRLDILASLSLSLLLALLPLPELLRSRKSVH